ncbi:MAG: prepilin-type N-terminal cleavage/methylation domain-containing protein [Holophaga sp.]|nr:prepilin-type N-terminal cleavage/methylation domain-containing protein [Holophaga sp.]
MSPGGASRAGRWARAGFSLLELVLVLSLVGILGGLAAFPPGLGSPALNAVQGELRASLEQAFLLAQARGCRVRVALGGQGGQVPACRGRPEACGAVPPLTLPPGVRWGMPLSGIPLPSGMERTRKAHLTGQAHPCVTVSPGHTAEASAWFLTDGRDAVCLRLSPLGQLTLLRWRHRLRRWERG